jgi:AhpD family alkylhydroperoxidase
MLQSKVEHFHQERAGYNEILAQYANPEIKRFLGIDTTSYQDGHLPKKTKELLGFVASLVLRCDDCILYHLIECHKQGVTSQELSEVIGIGLLVGGSITIPHIRRAVKVWHEELVGTTTSQAT